MNSELTYEDVVDVLEYLPESKKDDNLLIHYITLLVNTFGRSQDYRPISGTTQVSKNKRGQE